MAGLRVERKVAVWLRKVEEKEPWKEQAAFVKEGTSALAPSRLSRLLRWRCNGECTSCSETGALFVDGMWETSSFAQRKDGRGGPSLNVSRQSIPSNVFAKVSSGVEVMGAWCICYLSHESSLRRVRSRWTEPWKVLYQAQNCAEGQVPS